MRILSRIATQQSPFYNVQLDLGVEGGECKAQRRWQIPQQPFGCEDIGEERNAEIPFFADYNSQARAEAPSIAASDSLSEE